MRILVVHNRYLERGGEDETVDAEVALLRARGHTVTLLERDNREVARRGRWRTALGAVWSPEGARQVRAALARGAYDVVHVHNFFPLFSPAVLYAARAAGVPVVLSLHNYRLLCANGLLERAGAPCTQCVGRAVGWPAVWYGCYRGSRAGSAAVVAMQALHRWAGTWQRQVDVFVTFSDFARRLLLQAGLPPERVLVHPHFVAPDPGPGPAARQHVLFVGRLVAGKGVEDLMAAWPQVGSPWPLHIVGDGPLAPAVQRWAAGRPDVVYWGRLPRAAVYAAMQQAWLLVAPSRYYETFGRVVVEAFAAGTPALVSAHGALAELVMPGVTGAHVPPGAVEALAATLRELLAHPERLRAMGAAARQAYEARYTEAHGYARLLAVYRRAQQSRDPRRQGR